MTFTDWLQQKHIPDTEKITAVIQASGPNGIPESKLRGLVELPKKLVDDLLTALVQSRIIRVAERGGVRWYFSPL